MGSEMCIRDSLAAFLVAILAAAVVVVAAAAVVVDCLPAVAEQRLP